MSFSEKIPNNFTLKFECVQSSHIYILYRNLLLNDQYSLQMAMSIQSLGDST